MLEIIITDIECKASNISKLFISFPSFSGVSVRSRGVCLINRSLIPS